jgi:hypothetical protein
MRTHYGACTTAHIILCIHYFAYTTAHALLRIHYCACTTAHTLLLSFFKFDARCGVGGKRHDPATVPPQMTRYPLCRRLCGFQGRSRWMWKNLFLAGIRSPDRPARSESLHQLSFPDPQRYNDRCRKMKMSSL